VNATFEHNIASPIRHNPAILGDKSDEVRLSITLQVSKIAPIEGRDDGIITEGIGENL
jgi:hypothetical protein